MPVAIDAVNTPAAATGTTASLTTGAFSPAAGSVIVLLWGANHPTPSTDVSISSVTNTGGAVTWSRRARKNANAASDGGAGTAGGAEIWTGTAPGGAITVTANGVASGAGTEKSLAPIVLTSADTAALTNIGAAFSASGLPSVTVTGCSAGSHVLAVSSDWQALGAGTPGSAQTIISEFHTPSQMTMHWWRTTSVLAGAGSQTMNLTAPSGQQYNLVAIEIRDAGGAAAEVTTPLRPTLPLPMLIQMAAMRAASFRGATGAAITGTAVATPGGVTATAAGTPTVLGTAAALLDGTSAAALGKPTVTGTCAAALGRVAGTAAGTPTVLGTAAAALGRLTGTATVGAAAVTGTAAAALGRATAAAAGTPTVRGTALALLGTASATAAGKVTSPGTAVAHLGTAAATALGRRTTAGTAAAALGRLVATVSGATPGTGLAGRASGPEVAAPGRVDHATVALGGIVGT